MAEEEGETQGQQQSSTGHTLLMILLFGVLGLLALGVIILVVWLIYHYTRPKNTIPITTVATSAGTRVDGSNVMSTYTGSYGGMNFMAPPITASGCTQILNENYVGYRIVNNTSGYTVNFGIYNTYPGVTQCGATGASTYFTPIFVNPGTSLFWTDNTVNDTVFSFYYNSLILFTNPGGTNNSYYAIGGPNNTTNPINNTTQYLLVTVNSSSGSPVFSVVNNGS